MVIYGNDERQYQRINSNMSCNLILPVICELLCVFFSGCLLNTFCLICFIMIHRDSTKFNDYCYSEDLKSQFLACKHIKFSNTLLSMKIIVVRLIVKGGVFAKRWLNELILTYWGHLFSKLCAAHTFSVALISPRRLNMYDCTCMMIQFGLLSYMILYIVVFIVYLQMLHDNS